MDRLKSKYMKKEISSMESYHKKRNFGGRRGNMVLSLLLFYLCIIFKV